MTYFCSTFDLKNDEGQLNFQLLKKSWVNFLSQIQSIQKIHTVTSLRRKGSYQI